MIDIPLLGQCRVSITTRGIHHIGAADTESFGNGINISPVGNLLNFDPRGSGGGIRHRIGKRLGRAYCQSGYRRAPISSVVRTKEYVYITQAPGVFPINVYI